MRIGILDDDKEILELLENYIVSELKKTTIQEPVIIDKFETAFELYQFIDETKEKMDILFLDILLGKDNGIELGAKIIEKQSNVKIIFITGNIQYVEEIFNITPFALLLKPIRKEKVGQILIKAYNAVKQSQKQYITFTNRSGMVTLEIDNILYIESRGRYLFIYSEHTDEVKIIMTMSEIENQLPDFFVKSHRSYIINIHKIRKIMQKEVQLNDGVIVPVSQNRHMDVCEKFREYLEE
ncbi:MAG: response regulator transcription factor [Lachnospiraceae bacterium]|nr:response regulator transcription factor [Lachnospiraceae bacterium]